MKAIQINHYNKPLDLQLVNTPTPEVGAHQVLIKVKYAAVNPLDVLTVHGTVKLIHDYQMPLTLGNELVGTIEKTGDNVDDYHIGDVVYSRLPIDHLGAFAEKVTVDVDYIARIPQYLTLQEAVAIPLTGLTIYQALQKLNAQAGQTLLITGASGSFGQIAVPFAKQLGLTVYVTGNQRSRDRLMQLGAGRYFDYRRDQYWQELSNIDYVIDSVGQKEIEHEMQVLKAGGKLLSLVAMPNKEFAQSWQMPKWKQWLFGLAGFKLDRLAKKHRVNYYFIFSYAEPKQLDQVTKIIEKCHIKPQVDPHNFSLKDTKQALSLVENGKTNGKVLIKIGD